MTGRISLDFLGPPTTSTRHLPSDIMISLCRAPLVSSQSSRHLHQYYPVHPADRRSDLLRSPPFSSRPDSFLLSPTLSRRITSEPVSSSSSTPSDTLLLRPPRRTTISLSSVEVSFRFFLRMISLLVGVWEKHGPQKKRDQGEVLELLATRPVSPRVRRSFKARSRCSCFLILLCRTRWIRCRRQGFPARIQGT